MTATLCFIVCHAGPAEHFAAFADELSKDHKVRIWADLAAAPKFGEQQYVRFDEFDEASAKRIAESCQDASFVVTDLGHPFDILLQNALAQYAPKAKRFAYYDNPEIQVPGEYALLANEVMKLCPHVLIANAEIASHEIMGIGYYPIGKARLLRGKRQEEKERKRAEYFHMMGRKDHGERLCVLLGGNNSEFYGEAFPAFCKMAFDDPKTLFIVQPHPSGKMLELPEHVRQSQWLTMEMLIVADFVLYHQTSMAPLVAFAGVPIIQIGKKPYHDLLQRSGICFASNSDELKAAFEKTKRRLYPPHIVGFRQDWPDRLRIALQSA